MTTYLVCMIYQNMKYDGLKIFTTMQNLIYLIANALLTLAGSWSAKTLALSSLVRRDGYGSGLRISGKLFLNLTSYVGHTINALQSVQKPSI